MAQRKGGTNNGQETVETKGNMEEGVPAEAENLMRSREVAEKNKDKETQEEEEEKEANGGILNNLISNLMGATTTVDGKSGENIKKSECEDEDEDEKKRESSGAGILEKIISHLPGTLFCFINGADLISSSTTIVNSIYIRIYANTMRRSYLGFGPMEFVVSLWELILHS